MPSRPPFDIVTRPFSELDGYSSNVTILHDHTSWGRARPQRPLSPDQLAEAVQVGQRLLAEFRPLFERLPPNARSGLGLARHLKVDRGTATRFVSTFSRPGDGLDVLRQFPGVRGLQQILDAMATKELPKTTIAVARAATDRFERLIRELGPSQTKLIERITATHAQVLDQSPETHERTLLQRRKLLFEAAANALGQRSDLWVCCHVFRPTPASSTMMDHALLRGTFGYRARRDAPSYVFRNFGRNDGPLPAAPQLQVGDRSYQSLDETNHIDGMPGATFFQDFSTHPLPLVTSRGRGKEAVVVIDSERTSEDQGVDVTIAHVVHGNWRLPTLDTPPTHDVSAYVGTPCAKMIAEVYLHRSMAQQCVPTISLFRTSPGVFSNPADHWYDQLPYPPSLRLVTSHPDDTRSPLFPRQAQLIQTLFSKLGWDREQFLGYRIEVEYPYWCGFYCMMFDYTSSSSPE